MRLLLVEDEWRLAETVSEGLSRDGFVVDALDTLQAADGALRAVRYDAGILDLGLPDGDGLALLAGLRRRGSELPVLILTARDAIEDRVAGLDGGADDYLVKPFAMAELLARVKALLRRPGAALGTILTAGNLSFDSIGREVRIAERRVDLSRQELAVLEQLMRRQGRVVPRAVLEEKLYGFDAEPASNPVPVHVHHLRRRLEEAGVSIRIHTVRGIGYLLAEVDAAP
ncbi:MAG: response regulator [Gammaproteobacteria bacterium]|nr:response regulator [Gammaproteobacteria bacterium]